MFTQNLKKTRIDLLTILPPMVLLISTSVLSQAQTKAPVKTSEPLPLEVLKEFTDAYGRIKSDYVEAIDDKTILRNARFGSSFSLSRSARF